MKKFRFPLRSVATIRNLKEMWARDLFSKKVKAFAQAEENLRAICGRVSDLERAMASQRSGTYRPADAAFILLDYKNQTQAASQAAAESVAARNEMEAARQEWLESRRNLKVIDNLEQKARWVHRRESEREDQANLDDRTSALAARGSESTL